ncbi:MAG: hypothetical protein JW863_21480 [Chitinispirillaceae bacterium]|nr:hypothetical protein [Chitinispirillaceae bacterium]
MCGIHSVMKKMVTGTAVVLLGVCLPQPLTAAPSDSMQAASVRLSDGATMYFRLYVPRSYTSEKKYPIVVTLHGVGEIGTDNRIQVDREEITRLWMQDSVQKQYAPFILSPQSPDNHGWADGSGSASTPDVGVVKIIDSLVKTYSIDTTRLYVAGLSMGGAGTWGLVKSYPNKFAAVIPCAGAMGWNPDFTVDMIDGENTAKTPYWAFHGTADDIVLPLYSRRIDTAVIRAGFPVVHYTSSAMMRNPTGISDDSLWKAVSGGAPYLYSEITGGDHKAGWMEAWYHPMIIQWLFSKSKVNRETVFTWPPPGTDATPAVVAYRMERTPPAVFRVEMGTIAWKGVAELPATMELYSVKGALLMRKTVFSREGRLSDYSLASGTYILSASAQQWRQCIPFIVGIAGR